MDIIELDSEDYVHRYGLACDAVLRMLHPDWADEDDGLVHTSDDARAVALAVFEAIGVVEREPLRCGYCEATFSRGERQFHMQQKHPEILERMRRYLSRA
jgi:hypothetical protein